MNALDILLVLILLAAVILAVWCLKRRKKSGKGNCSCGCQNCSAPCHKHNPHP